VTPDPRSLLEAEGLSPSSWGNGPRERYGAHRHPYDKVLVAEAGSIVFHLRGGDVELRAGGRLDLPSGTEHSADVGPDGVSCLEAHLPSGTLERAPRLVAGWALSGGAAGDDRPAPEGPEAGRAAAADR
jgi:hypothetical protein